MKSDIKNMKLENFDINILEPSDEVIELPSKNPEIPNTDFEDLTYQKPVEIKEFDRKDLKKLNTYKYEGREPVKRDWALYNLVQDKEKSISRQLLNDALNFLNIKQKRIIGRPSFPINDMLKCLIIKATCSLTARGSKDTFKIFKLCNYLTITPHFNTVLKYLNNPNLTKYLIEINRVLIEQLNGLETYGSIDSSGWSTFDRKKWREVREDHKEHKYYVKLHILIGIKTKGILAFDISEGNRHDSPFFERLLKEATDLISLKVILGDGAYYSKENCKIAKSFGVEPFFKPRKNTSITNKGRMSALNNMLFMFKYNRQKFDETYYLRESVESTFGSLKRKFKPYLNCKNDVSQKNELMCTVIAHNLNVLAKCMIQFGIKTEF